MNKSIIVPLVIGYAIALIFFSVCMVQASQKRGLLQEVRDAQRAKREIESRYDKCMIDKTEVYAKMTGCLEENQSKTSYKNCCFECLEQTVSTIRTLTDEPKKGTTR